MYTVVHRYDLMALITEVNELIIKGYEPQGGIAVVRTTHDPSYYQAMYKK